MSAPAPPAFEPALHTTPYDVYRALSDGTPLRLVDVRPAPTAAALTLEGAERLRGARPPADDGRAIVLFDDDGRLATRLARRWRRPGRALRALYGGLELYDHALDPLVVGERRFLTVTVDVAGNHRLSRGPT